MDTTEIAVGIIELSLSLIFVCGAILACAAVTSRRSTTGKQASGLFRRCLNLPCKRYAQGVKTVTSDELPRRLKKCAALGNNVYSPWPQKELEEAAARIRELEAERDEAVTQMVEAKVERDKAQERIGELEAELEKYNTANVVVAMEKAAAFSKTHVIVPVEPTQQMAKAIHAAIDEAWDHPDVAVCLYRAMIRAAQPGASD